MQGEGENRETQWVHVSVWGDDRILEMDSGDGYTAQ